MLLSGAVVPSCTTRDRGGVSTDHTRVRRLSGGPDDLLRPSLGDRVLSAALTVAAACSIVMVPMVPAALVVTITAPFWLMLELSPRFGVYATLVLTTVSLLAYLPIMIETLRRPGRVVLARAGVAPLEQAQRQRLENVVAEVAVAAGVPTPEIVAVRRFGANSMTAGDPSRPTIAVSPDLLDLLDRQQLQAVLAHEVAHIMNRDIGPTTVLAVIYVL